MCGITGILNYQPDHTIQEHILQSMNEKLIHRGPDETGFGIQGRIGFGFRRLSIIDLKDGHQPMYSEDKRIMAVCNGEIYNFKELRQELKAKGHHFRTNCDVEVIIPLYLEYGEEFVKRLNGQFAIAIWDVRDHSLLLYRDHFGICPLFYTETEHGIVFGSEIKALLVHPDIRKEINMTALDQTLSFPGIISPHTMFENIRSIKPGCYIKVFEQKWDEIEFWDLDYPLESDSIQTRSEEDYADELETLLQKSISYRLNADVPVGFYLSGGLDSSLVGGMMKSLFPQKSYKSFSIGFSGNEHRQIDESYFQQTVSDHIGSAHHQINFTPDKIQKLLKKAVYFSECPLKETYNTCSLALSAAVKDNGVKVILSGEGADEIFGGYVGYRFDIQRRGQVADNSLEAILEEEQRAQLWGDKNFFYERDYLEFNETRKALYSDEVNESFEIFNSYRHQPVDRSKIIGRHPFHQRSYIDMKLRLSDHLVSDHCDRTCYANSVEGRYPFLDINLVDFARTVPPEIKLKNLVEKYLLKKVAGKYLPDEVVNRQKQGFVAPGSPYLLKENIEWINDTLSYDTVKRQGYFNPAVIERLKNQYSNPGFELNLPFDDDLLIVVLTFNILLEQFDVKNYSSNPKMTDYAPS